MKDNETRIEFKVIDNNTGKEADIGKIALKEDWAKGLMYCDMQGFAILDDGNLILLDECGKFEYCPSERFSIMFEDSVVLSREEYEDLQKAKDRIAELESENETKTDTIVNLLKKQEFYEKDKLKRFAERLKNKLFEFFQDNEELDGKISVGPLYVDVIGVEAKDGTIISLGLIDKLLKEYDK